MAYYDRPHAFVETEIDVALTLARQLGFGIRALRAEEARRVAEDRAQRLVFIVESSDDAIISKNLDGDHPDLESRARAAVRLHGRGSHRPAGDILIPPDRLDEEPEILARIRRGERIEHFETVRRRKDGTPDRHLADHFADPGQRRAHCRRLEDRARHHRRKERRSKLRDSEQPSAGSAGGHSGGDLHHRRPGQDHLLQRGGGRILRPHARSSAATNGASPGNCTWPDGTPLPHDQCPMAVALKEGRADPRRRGGRRAA